MQAQTPASPLGAGKMQSSIQFTLGWSRGQVVTAALASPKSYAALRRLGLAVLQICCRGTRGQPLKTQSLQGDGSNQPITRAKPPPKTTALQ
jgi:hypothetical protein